MLERLLLGENVADINTAQALTSKYPEAWQAWLVLAAAHASRRERRKWARRWSTHARSVSAAIRQPGLFQTWSRRTDVGRFGARRFERGSKQDGSVDVVALFGLTPIPQTLERARRHHLPSSR